ncbi:MAG: PIN domain-containing protein [Actinomycetota bacterium]|nr:PIN domain-containing protein [Actinomycetota bacterium]
MSTHPRGLLDTSFFVAFERPRPPRDAPELGAVSAITIAELATGVALAADPDVQRRRQQTLTLARRFDPLPFDERCAEAFATIAQAVRSSGGRVRQFDAAIAATALANDIAVFTQDSDDFGLMDRVVGALTVVFV